MLYTLRLTAVILIVLAVLLTGNSCGQKQAKKDVIDEFLETEEGGKDRIKKAKKIYIEAETEIDQLDLTNMDSMEISRRIRKINRYMNAIKYELEGVKDLKFKLRKKVSSAVRKACKLHDRDVLEKIDRLKDILGVNEEEAREIRECIVEMDLHEAHEKIHSLSPFDPEFSEAVDKFVHALDEIRDETLLSKAKSIGKSSIDVSLTRFNSDINTRIGLEKVKLGVKSILHLCTALFKGNSSAVKRCKEEMASTLRKLIDNELKKVRSGGEITADKIVYLSKLCLYTETLSTNYTCQNEVKTLAIAHYKDKLKTFKPKFMAEKDRYINSLLETQYVCKKLDEVEEGLSKECISELENIVKTHMHKRIKPLRCKNVPYAGSQRMLERVRDMRALLDEILHKTNMQPPENISNVVDKLDKCLEHAIDFANRAIKKGILVKRVSFSTTKPEKGNLGFKCGSDDDLIIKIGSITIAHDKVRTKCVTGVNYHRMDFFASHRFHFGKTYKVKVIEDDLIGDEEYRSKISLSKNEAMMLGYWHHKGRKTQMIDKPLGKGYTLSFEFILN